MKTIALKALIAMILIPFACLGEDLPVYCSHGEFTITAENDLFFKSDKYYTHGTKLGYLFYSAPAWTDKLIDGDKRWGITLGQYIYSPIDIEVGQMPTNDRPYGGWLYIGNSLFVRNDNKMDYFELDIGVTGPDSLAEPTQELIHTWTGSQTPIGWGNQIKETIGVDLAYQRKYKFGNGNFDFIPSYGGVVGNIFDYVNIGVMGRVGWNLPDDFGFYRSEPNTRLSRGGQPIIDWSKVSIFGFVSGEERWVLQNMFLDGDTYEHRYVVDPRPFVTDLMGGIGVYLGRFSIIVANNLRTDEFYGQSAMDRFSTVSISWRF